MSTDHPTPRPAAPEAATGGAPLTQTPHPFSMLSNLPVTSATETGPSAPETPTAPEAATGGTAELEMFTAVFRGTREQGRALGMLFGEASLYGELVHISLGNVVGELENLQQKVREAAHDRDAE